MHLHSLQVAHSSMVGGLVLAPHWETAFQTQDGAGGSLWIPVSYIVCLPSTTDLLLYLFSSLHTTIVIFWSRFVFKNGVGYCLYSNSSWNFFMEFHLVIRNFNYFIFQLQFIHCLFVICSYINTFIYILWLFGRNSLYPPRIQWKKISKIVKD